MKWRKASERPVFDENGMAHNLLFWDGDTLFSGSCENRGGNPVFIDWWVGGSDVDAQWWAPWPKKPTEENSNSTEIKEDSLALKELKDIIYYRIESMIEITDSSEGLFNYSEDIREHELALKIIKEIFEERKQYKERDHL